MDFATDAVAIIAPIPPSPPVIALATHMTAETGCHFVHDQQRAVFPAQIREAGYEFGFGNGHAEIDADEKLAFLR